MNDKLSTYISTPDICSQDLIFLIEIQNLDECETVVNSDSLRCVVDRPTDQANFVVVFKQMLNESLLIRHCQAPCKEKSKNSGIILGKVLTFCKRSERKKSMV